jgi:hypothetical protein
MQILEFMLIIYKVLGVNIRHSLSKKEAVVKYKAEHTIVTEL